MKALRWFLLSSLLVGSVLAADAPYPIGKVAPATGQAALNNPKPEIPINALTFRNEGTTRVLIGKIQVSTTQGVIKVGDEAFRLGVEPGSSVTSLFSREGFKTVQRVEFLVEGSTQVLEVVGEQATGPTPATPPRAPTKFKEPGPIALTGQCEQAFKVDLRQYLTNPTAEQLKWSGAGLPGWLLLDDKTGTLTGTPSCEEDVGVESFVISVVDGEAGDLNHPVQITIGSR